MSSTVEHRETEFKFRIPEGNAIDLQELLRDSSFSVVTDSPRTMDATYFDTRSLSLIRWGITLRQRKGGGDDGWHMKLPVTTGDSTSRDEIRVDRTTSTVPMELVSIAAPLLRRQELIPVARVRTDRSPFIIHSPQGTPLLEIVDDRVRVDRLSTFGGADGSTCFHEVEVELLADSQQARTGAKTIGQALKQAGALPSSVSKAAQALGRRAGDPPDVPQIPSPQADAPAIDAIQAMFSGYVRALLAADVGIRRSQPDSVHQLRVSCRRLRSGLRAFAPLLDPDTVAFLRSELAWLAAEMGQIRDAEVQREILTSKAPDESTREFIATSIDARMRAAISSAMAALRSDRHDFLIEDLVIFVNEPPVSSQAFEPAGPVLSQCMEDQWKKFRKRAENVSPGSSAHTWHLIRIRAKQARYAAEAVAPILGSGYSRLGRALAKVTTTLGSRQDAQVSEDFLRELATSAPSDIAFTLDRMAEGFRVNGDADQRAFLRMWPTVSHRAAAVGLQ